MNKQDLINSGIIVNEKINRNISRSKKLSLIIEDLKKEYPNSRSLAELIYMCVNEIIDIPKCEFDNNDVMFLQYSIGYSKYCCIECSRKNISKKVALTKLERYGDANYVNIEKRKKTNLEKYGVENTFSLDVCRKKSEETKLKKYGSKYPTSFGSDKFRKAMIEKYGVDHNSKSKKLLDKKRHHIFEKYGVTHSNKREEIKEKIKQTQYKKFGTYAFNTKEAHEKASNTMIEKYGTTNPMLNSDIILKYKKTIKEKTYKKYYNLPSVEALFSLEDYTNVHYSNKYLWKCKTCNNEFEDDIYAGRLPRCPFCFPIISGYSNIEREISLWIKSLNIKILENNKQIITPLELDIYIPSKNLAIEFNGLYWHSELMGKDSNYHLNKTNLCQENGIQLLHIFEDEWIEKQNIIKSIIKSKLGLYDKTIHGRKCTMKKINSNDANSFYEENHIQGKCTSKINLGLFYKDELVSCLSFSKSRYNKKYDWEITRFANKLGYKVYGSFSKLWKHKPEGSIITYSDKRLFDGSVYRKFLNELKSSDPSYWYLDSNYNRYNRTNFQKHKLKEKLGIFNSNLTEWENMQLNGYNRIWDCGNWIFEWRNK